MIGNASRLLGARRRIHRPSSARAPFSTVSAAGGLPQARVTEGLR